MPRKARVKSPESIYHIMCRSLSEFLLFRDDGDKDYYLRLLKRYMDTYKCSLYAYCLMDNHFHLHLDPKGFDISKLMHGLNTAYVRYYNKKYQRHGPVFQDRFQSRVLDTAEYNFAVSAYIHNNPHDIQGLAGREEAYPYSSYGTYLGIRKDIRKLIDMSFMMGLFNASDIQQFPKNYCGFVRHQRDIGSLTELKKKLEIPMENQYISGKRHILRQLSPSKVISFISSRILDNIPQSLAPMSIQKQITYRSFAAFALRVLCGLGYREICNSLYNTTISGCSRLCAKGYELLCKEPTYQDIFNELVDLRA